MSSNTAQASSPSFSQVIPPPITLLPPQSRPLPELPPPSLLLPELPPRPAPVRQGNAFARIFSRRSARNEDIEIAEIGQPRVDHPRLHIQETFEERRQRRNQVIFTMKLAVGMTIVIAFWVWVMLWASGIFNTPKKI